MFTKGNLSLLVMLFNKKCVRHVVLVERLAGVPSGTFLWCPLTEWFLRDMSRSIVAVLNEFPFLYRSLPKAWVLPA